MKFEDGGIFAAFPVIFKNLNTVMIINLVMVS